MYLFWSANILFQGHQEMKPMFIFYTPWKYQKTIGFFIISEVMENSLWPEMGP